nr:cobalamin-dependent protein [Gammaproteobacteria bacterium]
MAVARSNEHKLPSDAAAGRRQPRRFVTAASLFDGHDAAINVMRRILQGTGAEVIHLAHNRSVEEVVRAALEEDVHGIAVSSYQGGHVEYFKYMVDMLQDNGAGHIRVFGGGGGVIVPEEVRELHDYGVERIYTPEDGQKMGLQGMIEDMVERADADLTTLLPADLTGLESGDPLALARVITGIETGGLTSEMLGAIKSRAGAVRIPVLGITGTGGAGKSSMTDEIIRRLRLDHDDELRIAVLAADPSRRRTGGALLGDRIRMNAINHPNIYMRSLATRVSGQEVPDVLPEAIACAQLSGFDLVIVETSGIGQGDAAIVPLVDVTLYVMTPEFGAASQLEKIDMLDFADVVAINKFDRKGASDALRDVRKQVQRNREAFGQSPDDMPVYGTVASRFNDDGVTALYHGIAKALKDRGLVNWTGGRLPKSTTTVSSNSESIVPPQRARYLAEIAEASRAYRADVEAQTQIARERQQLRESQRMLTEAGAEQGGLGDALDARDKALSASARALLDDWPDTKATYRGDQHTVVVREREITTELTTTSLSGSRIPKVVVPDYHDEGDILKWLMLENVPGRFPFTAGVFPFKREGEDPSRMFAGEGDAFKTNK